MPSSLDSSMTSVMRLTKTWLCRLADELSLPQSLTTSAPWRLAIHPCPTDLAIVYEGPWTTIKALEMELNALSNPGANSPPLMGRCTPPSSTRAIAQVGGPNVRDLNGSSFQCPWSTSTYSIHAGSVQYSGKKIKNKQVFGFPNPNFQHPLPAQSQPRQILYRFHEDGREVEEVGGSQGNDYHDIISLPPVYNTIGTFCAHSHASKPVHDDSYQSGSRALQSDKTADHKHRTTFCRFMHLIDVSCRVILGSSCMTLSDFLCDTNV